MDIGYVFWGAGSQGALAADVFETCHSKDEGIYGYIDNNRTGAFKGYGIVSCDSCTAHKLVITVDNSQLITDILSKARNIGYEYIYWFTGVRNKETGNFLDDYCVDCSGWGSLILPQAEIHVVDYCNLNCRGCTHFSPIFEKVLPDTAGRLKDIEILKSKFSHIVKFFLLGGEPFLNPDINTYITETRRLLPDTMIQIVTNGLLIPKLDAGILKTLHDNDIVVSISEYLPTHKIINQIIRKLEENSIRYIIRSFDSKMVFNKPLSLAADSKYEKKCISNGCVNIWNGKIARCPTLMYIERFNKVFGTRLPDIGIYDLNELDGERILEIISETVPLCGHCVSNDIEWGRCGTTPELEDFAERD